MKSKDTLSQTMNNLRDKGYNQDFNLLDDHLQNKNEDKTYSVENFEVDDYFRFEGMSNPADNSILFAITTSDGTKGLLVDGYGITSGQVSKHMLNKLKLK